MGGITGRPYQQYALPIASSVIISALNALTLSPALSAKLLRPAAKTQGPLGRFFAGFNRWFERATNGYISFTGVLIRKTARSLLFLVMLAVAAGGLGRGPPGGVLPGEENR